jgi:hypothetical protein
VTLGECDVRYINQAGVYVAETINGKVTGNQGKSAGPDTMVHFFMHPDAWTMATATIHSATIGLL